MKLSEAILLGSVGTEQGFGEYSAYKGAMGRCAMGAALFAVGAEIDFLRESDAAPFNKMDQLWPWVVELVVDVPDGAPRTYQAAHGEDRALFIIWRLNDLDKWTRPQIAAWIATIEPQEVPNEMPTMSGVTGTKLAE